MLHSLVYGKFLLANVEVHSSGPRHAGIEIEMHHNRQIAPNCKAVGPKLSERQQLVRELRQPYLQLIENR
jgi:hypothetical protein